jgi:hypothetical protein
MSGVRGYPMPPYSHIPYMKCPICGKPVKNFEMHTRNNEKHKEFRLLAQETFRKLVREHCQMHPNIYFDSGIIISLSQKAWRLAIEQISGKPVEYVEVEKKLPSYAITENTICPKTNQKANKNICGMCLDFALGKGFYVCLELKQRKWRQKYEA